MGNKCPTCGSETTDTFRDGNRLSCVFCDTHWIVGATKDVYDVTTNTIYKADKPAVDQNVGRKNDADKPAVQYIPMVAIFAEGKAFAAGVKKYGAWNYTKGMAVTRPLGGAIRHIFQFLSGEDYDQETGAHHLGCARANLGMALDILERRPDLDDRPKK